MSNRDNTSGEGFILAHGSGGSPILFTAKQSSKHHGGELAETGKQHDLAFLFLFYSVRVPCPWMVQIHFQSGSSSPHFIPWKWPCRHIQPISPNDHSEVILIQSRWTRVNPHTMSTSQPLNTQKKLKPERGQRPRILVSLSWKTANT